MSHFARLIALHGLVTTTSLAAPGCSGQSGELPSSMLAFVAESATDFKVQQFRTPSLGDLHRKFADLPDACEVLVNVHASSVNPADTYAPGPYPQVMGSDIVATVLATEATCARLKVGDEVWGDLGAFAFSAGKRGKQNGGYGQIAVALESQLVRKPSNVDLVEVAALPKVALTSYKALAWYGGAPYTADTKVLVLGGSGGCGTTGIQLAKWWGAAEIITTTSEANIPYVMGLGATRVIEYHTQNWWEVLGDGSLDVIYDTMGNSGTGDLAMPKLKVGGHYVGIAGAAPTKPREDVHVSNFINSVTNLNNTDILEALVRAVEDDALRMKSVKAYTLSDIGAAFAESRQGHVVGKLAITLPPLSTDECIEI